MGKFVPLSPDEFLGHMASVIYMGGCNWRCPYCNVPKMLDKTNCDEMLTSELFTEIIHAREFIDSVVFTGGEPTVQSKALLSLCELVKGEGLFVKVHTNGSMPGVIEELVVRGLVDKLCIDVKALYKDYLGVSGADTDEVEKVKESINWVKENQVPWEAVIPVIKGINDWSVPDIAKQAGAPLTVLKAFEPGKLVDSKFIGEAPSRSDLIAFAKKCPGKVHIKTKLYGEEDIV